MDDRSFRFHHPWYLPLRAAGWVLLGATVLGALSAGLAGVPALVAGIGVGGALLAWLVRRAAAIFGPVEVSLNRHRVRIEHDGEVHGDVLVEDLDGGAVHDVVLYVLRAGHDGPIDGLTAALEERLRATASGRPLAADATRQLEKLRS
jgi:hypothetical protein